MDQTLVHTTRTCLVIPFNLKCVSLLSSSLWQGMSYLLCPGMVCQHILFIHLFVFFLTPAKRLRQYMPRAWLFHGYSSAPQIHHSGVKCRHAFFNSTQGLSSYSRHPDKVFRLISVALTWSVILNPSRDKVCHLVPLTMTRSVILSPSPWQTLWSYTLHLDKVYHPLHPDKVCYHIIFTLTRSVVLSPSPRQGLL